MQERTVDFAAVGRVSKRVELKSIRLTEVSAKCDRTLLGPLEPTIEVNCEVARRESSVLEIACKYQFVARTTQSQVADATITYHLLYELQGAEPLADDDVAQFSFANGTLHSWPFVREFLYALTSRMGFPPYTLPVFHFNPKPQEKKTAPETSSATPGPIQTTPI